MTTSLEADNWASDDEQSGFEEAHVTMQISLPPVMLGANGAKDAGVHQLMHLILKFWQLNNAYVLSFHDLVRDSDCGFTVAPLPFVHLRISFKLIMFSVVNTAQVRPAPVNKGDKWSSIVDTLEYFPARVKQESADCLTLEFLGRFQVRVPKEVLLLKGCEYMKSEHAWFYSDPKTGKKTKLDKFLPDPVYFHLPRVNTRGRYLEQVGRLIDG